MEPVVRENVTVSRSVETPEVEPEPEFVPHTTDRPVGLDLDEFLPVSCTHPDTYLNYSSLMKNGTTINYSFY